jgi:hypothetical protein
MNAPPLKKRAVLAAMFHKIGECFGQLETVNVRLQHLEQCHGVMLDQQRDLLRSLEAECVERQKLAATNRMLIEHNMRLIAHGSAYLKALGIQAYVQIQAREAARLPAPSTPNDLTAEDMENIRAATREINKHAGGN